MTTPDYLFASTQAKPEYERLQLIEAVFDGQSQRRLLQTGLTGGWSCLEVGAGAGSITRWLAAIAGDSGQVTALDRDTRFLKGALPGSVQVIEGDICTEELPAASFDLIHARFVLIHIPTVEVALEQMVRLLKSGGWLVLEEPDFLAARPAGMTADLGGSITPETLTTAMTRVNQAILQTFVDRGIDPAVSLQLPQRLETLGLRVQTVDNHAPLVRGNSAMAQIMARSARQLATLYTATGKASPLDVEHYCQYAQNSHTWAIYHGIVGIQAQAHL
ncbi:class I SAM-dependent methyltransferase [Leptolyngbya sp. PCC 6406]|uniref:class I SAM-dependent methyltransferase n=1 Tax=Leptolyngbya sp. PCC 6406 TaxID=1173264 RepID=UPI0002ACA7E9|nr:class I SAM-dependent methyltransferase [Leptolyngbya sp. PCC 6406]